MLALTLTSITTVDGPLIEIEIRQSTNFKHVVARFFYDSFVPIFDQMLDQI